MSIYNMDVFIRLFVTVEFIVTNDQRKFLNHVDTSAQSSSSFNPIKRAVPLGHMTWNLRKNSVQICM